MPNHPIRAVFLDAGNTLFTEVRPRPETYAAVAASFGGNQDAEAMALDMSDAYARLPSSLDGFMRFSIGWFRFFNDRVLGSHGVPEASLEAAHDALVACFENPSSYHLFPEVGEVLEELSNRGILTGVVSNWSESLPALCRGLGIADRVDFIVASAEVRSEKPDRAIFERALFRAGISPEETLHVGDHMDRDVRGAVEAGLRAALLDRDTEFESTREGFPVVSDLRGILPLVEQATHAVRT